MHTFSTPKACTSRVERRARSRYYARHFGGIPCQSRPLFSRVYAVSRGEYREFFARIFKLSPLGANVKQLGESGFAIYKSVIQRETSEIWASVLAGRAEAPVTGAVPTKRRCHGPKDIASCTRLHWEAVLRGPRLLVQL